LVRVNNRTIRIGDRTAVNVTPVDRRSIVRRRRYSLTCHQTKCVARRRAGRQFIDYLWAHPVELLAVGFLTVIVFGTLLLMLPAACVNARGTPPLDALFTATSATCVTGLTVVDTAGFFTPFGWAVIAALIQAGGLGVMTLSTLAAVVARPGGGGGARAGGAPGGGPPGGGGPGGRGGG
jgi:hypothetical protein